MSGSRIQTSFTRLLGIEHPIAALNRSPSVVAEVTKAGGLGVLAATAYDASELDAQLTWIEEQIGDLPYGVDLLVPAKTADTDSDELIAGLRAQIPAEHTRFVAELLRRYDIPPVADDEIRYTEQRAVGSHPSAVSQLLDVAFGHRIGLVANALGPPPAGLIERARTRNVIVASLVGSTTHAERQLAAGVDVLIAQGTEAGGHTGSVASMVLTPEVVQLAQGIPVLSAGGIGSGAQMAAALTLGAAGVWCGSVWLSSTEDITPVSVKRKFLAASSADTLRSRARTGKPARQLRSAYHDEWERPDSPQPLPMPLQGLLTMDAWNRIYAAAEAGHAGAVELETFFVGQIVGSFHDLRPTAEITQNMVTECLARIASLQSIVSS
jgi:NAD(P)H-dependent flavin oxidoreductase YrpB (nitropropane dioxygenase family)